MGRPYSMDQQPPEPRPRAPRFAIPMWMLYRTIEDPRWRAGRTENISRTGVLFRPEELMEPNTSIEMLLAMPVEVLGDAAGTTMCRGRVVRAVTSSTFDDRPAVAAAILDCDAVSLPDPRRI